jgi:hypothetical protein
MPILLTYADWISSRPTPRPSVNTKEALNKPCPPSDLVILSKAKNPWQARASSGL